MAGRCAKQHAFTACKKSETYFRFEGLSDSAKRHGRERYRFHIGVWSACRRHNEDMVSIPAGRFHMGERKDRVHFPQAGRASGKSKTFTLLSYIVHSCYHLP